MNSADVELLRSRELLGKLPERGGFTIQPGTGQEPNNGYGVSIYPEHEKIYDITQFRPSHIREYLAAHVEQFADPATYLGAWHDVATGRVYLDITTKVDIQEEADRLARTHHQEAYFDFAHQTIVRVNARGD